MWEVNSYRDLLSENAGERHVVGSALLMLTAAVLMLFVFA